MDNKDYLEIDFTDLCPWDMGTFGSMTTRFFGPPLRAAAAEAARLAKLSGKPVQVAWSRKEEFFYDSFRPAAVVKINSGVSDTGQIAFWDYSVYFAGQRGSQHLTRERIKEAMEA